MQPMDEPLEEPPTPKERDSLKTINETLIRIERHHESYMCMLFTLTGTIMVSILIVPWLYL